MTKTIRVAAMAAAFAAAPLTAALADRGPSPEERTIISDVLYSQGFTSWGKIELDDGEWEVDNVIDQDGRAHDLTLNSSFVITHSEDDDDSAVKVRVR